MEDVEHHKSDEEWEERGSSYEEEWEERGSSYEEWEERGSTSSDENVVTDYIFFGSIRSHTRWSEVSTPTLNEDEDDDELIMNEKMEDDEKEKESVVSSPHKPTTTTHQQNQTDHQDLVALAEEATQIHQEII